MAARHGRSGVVSRANCNRGLSLVNSIIHTHCICYMQSNEKVFAICSLKQIYTVQTFNSGTEYYVINKPSFLPTEYTLLFGFLLNEYCSIWNILADSVHKLCDTVVTETTVNNTILPKCFSDVMVYVTMLILICHPADIWILKS